MGHNRAKISIDTIEANKTAMNFAVLYESILIFKRFSLDSRLKIYSLSILGGAKWMFVVLNRFSKKKN